MKIAGLEAMQTLYGCDANFSFRFYSLFTSHEKSRNRLFGSLLCRRVLWTPDMKEHSRARLLAYVTGLINQELRRFIARTVAYYGRNGEEYVEAHPAVELDCRGSPSKAKTPRNKKPGWSPRD